MNITPQLTRDLWRAMTDRFETKVIPKRRSPMMRCAGLCLGLMRIMSYETFMDRYTTVVAGRVYPWFTVGEGDRGHLWHQLVVCVHEHQHVVQARRDGLLGFHLPYLLSDRRRALIEAEAYRCNLEMNWWRNRQMPDPHKLGRRLSQYGCGDGAVRAACEYLDEAASDIRRGQILNEASRAAIEWLESR